MENSFLCSKEFIEIRNKLKRIEKLLTSNKDVLNLEDACNYTGLSKSTLYQLTSQARIPHFKPNGKLIYFDKNELNTWLKQNKVETQDSILERFQF
jgi:excisionase family DNA binding protein